MSHFTVLVIGDNVDDQLEQYSEHIEMDEYVTGEVTDEQKQSFIDHYTKEDPKLLGTSDKVATLDEIFEELYEKKGYEWNNSEYKKINGVWSEVSTYNPKSKWDWYEIGGRWAGFFMLRTNFEKQLAEIGFSRNEFDNLIKLKENNLEKFVQTVSKYKGYDDKINLLIELHGKTSIHDRNAFIFGDQAKKGDINFEGMRIESREKAIKRYENLESIFGEIPKMTLTFEEAQKQATSKKGKIDYDKARELYWAQPALKQVQDARTRTDLTDEQKSSVIWIDLNDYQCTKEEYGQRAYNSGVSTHAVVKDGKWYQKGEMGWFGISTDTSTQEEWDAELNKLIDSVSDDTLFTLIDAHI